MLLKASFLRYPPCAYDLLRLLVFQLIEGEPDGRRTFKKFALPQLALAWEPYSLYCSLETIHLTWTALS